MGKISIFFTFFNSLDINKRIIIFKIGLNIVKLPIIRKIYSLLYWSVIHRKSVNMPNNIVIEPYNICNLKCTMCPYPIMTREKEQMNMSLFRAIIDDASENGFVTLTFSLYNEPLLDDLLFERIKYAKGKGFKVFFNTNGTLLTREKMQEIIDSGLDHIIFSFDAPTKGAYENIRVNANFEVTIQNIRKFIEYRSEMHSLTPTIGIASVGRFGNHILNQMRKIFKGADSFVTSEEDNRRRTCSNNFAKGGDSDWLYPCHAIWNSLVVSSSGKVFLCCWDYDGSIEMGDLNKQTIKDVWNSSKFKKVRDAHLNRKGDKIGLCKECNILYRSSPFVWWFI